MRIDGEDITIPPQRELTQLGNMPDPTAPAFSRAGRSLQKHGYRPGSVYPRVSGPPSHYNGIAGRILAQIVESPGSIIELKSRIRFGSVVSFLEVIAADGGKVGYKWDYETRAFQFEGFREPLRIRPPEVGNPPKSKGRDA